MQSRVLSQLHICAANRIVCFKNIKPFSNIKHTFYLFQPSRCHKEGNQWLPIVKNQYSQKYRKLFTPIRYNLQDKRWKPYWLVHMDNTGFIILRKKKDQTDSRRIINVFLFSYLESNLVSKYDDHDSTPNMVCDADSSHIVGIHILKLALCFVFQHFFKYF